MADNFKKLADRVSLRSVVIPDDENFLIKLYFSTRDDVDLIPIPQQQKDDFKMMQYTAQKNHYSAHYAGAKHDIILLDGKPVGRLMIEREPDKILGVDISILPEFRSHGIGTVLIEDLLAEARQTSRVFSIHVIQNNQAIRFYKRLGLAITGETGAHFKMESVESPK